MVGSFYPTCTNYKYGNVKNLLLYQVFLIGSFVCNFYNFSYLSIRSSSKILTLDFVLPLSHLLSYWTRSSMTLWSRCPWLFVSMLRNSFLDLTLSYPSVRGHWRIYIAGRGTIVPKIKISILVLYMF